VEINRQIARVIRHQTAHEFKARKDAARAILRQRRKRQERCAFVAAASSKTRRCPMLEGVWYWHGMGTVLARS
jgi:hypothetical protein